ncbi:dephospho-CoA kinase [Aneurinibacillus aneurinilyticus]|jgi:dephospho-CoA kinase|uniref:Dephospho-CoA kinase n=2 Tax=Aneurinibacillus aneurinilyticus TaxID=1391 RepID=A0A848D000_ANEAE|nr:dephospho-CoA kinase [Aneurinibacillus aneurinilyticus]ERI08623.1 dephospho-CoA kinase [Aneurinibacillus aneurinilyticus ATCC 12856]MCI1693509.1 dephospho-CoA kinase [Aneurinibacillus aneurinilyticus]MED0672387.1 dephospho-CoA kinase [Aneurinibacillus aneurinilyticus]MED0706147.1 dephospho-CoA kinase [Aneurinibacillus aneurinilyticus]MED0725121.1 dephospho-CoA kinase [Aneurinibacillus aneurinilyticus]
MVIGLTGGIACGKSTVSRMLAERDARIIDADMIAREVVRPGEEAWSLVVERFGRDILLANDELDRTKLGSLVFSDEQARLDLNAIVHPAIRGRMRQLIKEAQEEKIALIVLDIPLLYESKLEYMVEKVVVVYCTANLQLERLMERNGFDEEEARRRIASQLSIEDKRLWADYVIDNNGTLSETEQQVDELVGILLNLE